MKLPILKFIKISLTATMYISLLALFTPLQLLAQPVQPAKQQLDIFVSFSSNLNTSINNFNTQLNQANITKKYQIKPFINKYPPHITMYLTRFNMNSIENIKSIVKEIVGHTNKFKVTSSKF